MKICVCWLDAYVNNGIIAIVVSFTYHNFIFIIIIIFIWSAFVLVLVCVFILV